jgi:hypothetical protein
LRLLHDRTLVQPQQATHADVHLSCPTYLSATAATAARTEQAEHSAVLPSTQACCLPLASCLPRTAWQPPHNTTARCMQHLEAGSQHQSGSWCCGRWARGWLRLLVPLPGGFAGSPDVACRLQSQEIERATTQANAVNSPARNSTPSHVHVQPRSASRHSAPRTQIFTPAPQHSHVESQSKPARPVRRGDGAGPAAAALRGVAARQPSRRAAGASAAGWATETPPPQLVPPKRAHSC